MQRRREKCKTHLLRLWREWGKPLLVVFIVLGSFRSAVADWNDVPTGSMKPTILEGERILVDKLAYGLRLPFTRLYLVEWNDPRRGDIVVCFSPTTGTRLVKRVVGLPGDLLEMVENHLVINGRPLSYRPADPAAFDHLPEPQQLAHGFARERLGSRDHPIMLTPGSAARRNFRPVVVPPDHYFVMGDNRDNSGDSRIFGFVPRQQIVGRAMAVVASLDPNRYYLPRWTRFFHGLH
jgi:signal peptidase I